MTRIVEPTSTDEIGAAMSTDSEYGSARTKPGPPP